MLTRYPLQQGLKPPRNLYVYGSLQALYEWINKQREVGPAIHRTLEFTATALEHPFRTTPHIWRQEHTGEPALWSFRWQRDGVLPGLGEQAAVYAMPHGPHAVLVHWNNERAGAAQKRSLEAAVRQAQACLDYIDDTARQQAQATGGGR
jgi:hypothetical protein